MKATLFLSSIALGASLLPLAASNVVISNLAQNSAGTSLRDSQGQLLPGGCLVQAGHFPGKSPQEIAELAQSGPAALLAALVPFGSPTTIGTGMGGMAGTIEFTASSPLTGEIAGGLHVVMLNAANPQGATELLLLKVADAIPADDPSGLPGYLAVHLRDAAAVFGTTNEEGFATSGGSTGGFADWITAQLPAGTPPADLLPDADPDADGLANLLEYVLGASPSQAEPSSVLLQQPGGGGMAFRFLRSDASEADTIQLVQWSTDLATWHDIAVNPVPDASVTIIENGADNDEITVTIPFGESPGVYARLRVTEPD